MAMSGDRWTRDFQRRNRRLRVRRALTELAWTFVAAIAGLCLASALVVFGVAIAIRLGGLPKADSPMVQHAIDGVAMTVPVVTACMALEWWANKRRRR